MFDGDVTELSEMRAEEKDLYTRYYYNSVTEFIYFIILYIETHGTTSVSVFTKHVKFFKTEIANFISSFEGKTLADKLHQMLNTLDCFLLYDNKVKIADGISFKNIIFEDLVLSKCVDSILRKKNKVEDLCKSLNNNNVISIEKEDLLSIIRKYSFISLRSDNKVELRHVHGLFGFDDHLCKYIINYFYEILFRGKILSIKEVKEHSKLLKFCGFCNILIIFSLLNCNSQFICQNGYIWLNKKFKKYPRKKAINVQHIEAKFLSRTLPIGQVVYNTYGSSLYKWSGEICYLTETSGNVYCVIDFTNGNQGIFNIWFNVTALKMISDISDLRNYLSIRDTVEFDAEYYCGKRLDRCWKATRLKLLNCKNIEYDETLSTELIQKSERYRSRCVKCYTNVNEYLKVQKSRHPENQFSEIVKTSDYDSCSLSDSPNEIESVSRNNNNTVIAHYPCESVYNPAVPNYVIMFGFFQVYLLCLTELRFRR